MIDLKTRWASLSPGVQRVVAWGAGASVLLVLAAIAVQSAPHDPRIAQRYREVAAQALAEARERRLENR